MHSTPVRPLRCFLGALSMTEDHNRTYEREMIGNTGICAGKEVHHGQIGYSRQRSAAYWKSSEANKKECPATMILSQAASSSSLLPAKRARFLRLLFAF